MVCTEEVLLWFKDLESYKRISLLYDLLNMCLPLELRFLGTCVEDLGKHSYQELRGSTITSNDLEKLSKDPSLGQSLLDKTTRHRVIVNLSLLSSRNYSVANWLYKKLLRTECIENFIVRENVKDDLQTEFLLLFTMAYHHPAFTFEQKQFFVTVLEHLLHCSASKGRMSPKPSVYGCPPGFCPKAGGPEVPIVPVKTAETAHSYSDLSIHPHPPGLPLPPPMEMHNTWSLPAFACAVPEVFPPLHMSPLVSQTGSPSHSRSTSPHRTPLPVRQPPPPNPLSHPNIEILTVPPVPLEQLSQPSLQPMFSNEEEIPSPPEEKLRELIKPNGMRYPGPIRLTPAPPVDELLDKLTLNSDNAFHNSSSSNSSPNQTPPGTPVVTPHGPGRGEAPPRVNGTPFAPLCEATTPPPLPPAFTNCSVPYSFSQTIPLPLTRSIHPFSQNFRPPFTAQYPFPPDYYPNFSNPYYVYSSQFGPRTSPGCYNCGSASHLGQDCTQQNIEEITQKKTYQLEYSASSSDQEK